MPVRRGCTGEDVFHISPVTALISGTLRCRPSTQTAWLPQCPLAIPPSVQVTLHSLPTVLPSSSPALTVGFYLWLHVLDILFVNDWRPRVMTLSCLCWAPEGTSIWGS